MAILPDSATMCQSIEHLDAGNGLVHVSVDDNRITLSQTSLQEIDSNNIIGYIEMLVFKKQFATSFQLDLLSDSLDMCGLICTMLYKSIGVGKL
jgi:hypothetical protein